MNAPAEMTLVEHTIARADFAAIAAWVRPGAHVLDLGCGDGALLAYLTSQRQVTGYGVEIDAASVLACVRNGVNVIQGNLERGLEGFADHSFDCVILSQTLQAMMNTDRVISEMLRVGREGIVTFPNFGYWRNRVQVALRGQMPVSDNLPFQWWSTPNIHLCTVDDFERYCRLHGVNIRERIVLTGGAAVEWLPNLRGALAVYRFAKAPR